MSLLAAVGPVAESIQTPEAVRFEDVTEDAGITFRHGVAHFHERLRNVMPWITAGGAGVAVGDYNNDGLDDLYFTTSAEHGMNALYRNEGNFAFTDVAVAVGLADVNCTEKGGTSAFALWLDFNNDGWQDLLLLRFGNVTLFQNTHGTFKDVTVSSGIFRHMNALAAVAFDYDRDGDLDIYIGGYFPGKDLRNPQDSKVLFESWETARNGGENVLLRNNGDLTFTDVTDVAGVQDTGWTMAVGHGDIDNDGWQDLYVANDFGPDTIFKNLGNGRFKNITRDSIGVDTKKGMNAEFGDYNNDGYLDVYVTNMTEPYLHECNMLWRNNRDGSFTDVAVEEKACDTGWGWGAKFLDVDNDGYLDIYAVNGFISAGPEDYIDQLLEFIFRDDVDLRDASAWPPMEGRSMGGYEHNIMLWRTPRGYASMGSAAGVADVRDGRGVAIGDLDADGRMDIVVSNLGASPIIYRNVSRNPHAWLELRLEGRGKASNRSAIGARVEVRAGLHTQIREVAGGNGFDAQSTLMVHFGLGMAHKVDELSITWPDGKVNRFKAVPVNHVYTLTQDGLLTVWTPGKVH